MALIFGGHAAAFELTCSDPRLLEVSADAEGTAALGWCRAQLASMA